ncbi:hypothetical protein ABK040_007697 [Willaertia magna]
MRDKQTKLACDLHIPVRQDGSVLTYPTIIQGTRYNRSYKVRFPFNYLLGETFDVKQPFNDQFTKHGYVMISCDVRGTGASGGTRKYELYPEETEDFKDLIDWVTQQPWSNKLVGSYGVSYDGIITNSILATQHPSVKAIAPLFSPFDLYRDVIWPNGILSINFLTTYSKFARGLELNQGNPSQLYASPIIYFFSNFILDGVATVPGEEDYFYNTALRQHLGNKDLLSSVLEADSIDKKLEFLRNETFKTLDELNRFHMESNLEKKDVGLLGITSWMDGGIVRSTINRHLSFTTKYKTLIIGPFDHGAMTKNASPFFKTRNICFDLTGELIGFFDYHLKYLPYVGSHNNCETMHSSNETLYNNYESFGYYYRDTKNQSERVKYYEIQEEEWKYSNEWPPKDYQTEILAVDQVTPLETRYLESTFNYNISMNSSLSLIGSWSSIPSNLTNIKDKLGFQLLPENKVSNFEEKADKLTVDYSFGTGKYSRWQYLWQMNPSSLKYEVFNSQSLLNYTSLPLQHDIDMTGHPYLDVSIKANNLDAILFCYLLELDESKAKTTYITEGFIRASHRRYAKLNSELSDVKNTNTTLLSSEINKINKTVSTSWNANVIKTVEPFRSYSVTDIRPLIPDVYEEIGVFFFPISYKIKKGSSLVLAFSGWDKDNFNVKDIIPNLSTEIEIKRSNLKLHLPIKKKHVKFIN